MIDQEGEIRTMAKIAVERADRAEQKIQVLVKYLEKYMSPDHMMELDEELKEIDKQYIRRLF